MSTFFELYHQGNINGIIEWLEEPDSDPNEIGSGIASDYYVNQYFPLNLACAKGDLLMVKILSECPKTRFNFESFLTACTSNQVDIVKFFLELNDKRIDYNRIAYNDMNVLML